MLYVEMGKHWNQGSQFYTCYNTEVCSPLLQYLKQYHHTIAYFVFGVCFMLSAPIFDVSYSPCGLDFSIDIV